LVPYGCPNGSIVTQTGAVYTIGQVSDVLGVPAPTIRSWERRYGLRPDGHTEAAHRLDDAAVAHVLDLSRTLHGLDATVDLVLLPAMRELGEQWAGGLAEIAHEHLATTTVQTWLAAARPRVRPPAVQPPVVLACGPDEQHSLALDALAVLLAHRGLPTLYLGARVPAPSLHAAVRDSGARAVVLTCQLSRNRRSAVGALQELAASPADVCYAGAAFATPASRRDVPGHYLGESLRDAVDQLEARDTRTHELSTRGPGPSS
jgi:MerR family transcriptional regulator, light-induced transcriptional regulator